VEIDGKELVIDPGVGSTSWVVENVKNPLAILNTHGHFDHVWCNDELQKRLKIPLFIHKDDAFLLEDDIFGTGMPSSKPDILVQNEETIDISGVEFKFIHFPGHTPGCCMIEVGGEIFSGDFIFRGSIGRYDFPYSNSKDMRDSLIKFSNIKDDKKLHPGHGGDTTLREEQKRISYWLEMV